VTVQLTVTEGKSGDKFDDPKTLTSTILDIIFSISDLRE